MALKALGRKGSKKLSFLLGSSKHNSNAPPEYKEEDTQVPLPPLIERPRISPELESEIRYACALLYYSIEHEEMMQFSQDFQPAARPQTKTEVKVTSTEYLSWDNNSQESRHDSGIGLGDQPKQQHQPNSNGVPRFYRQHMSENIMGAYSEPTTASWSPTCRSTSMSSDHHRQLLDPDNRQADEESSLEETSLNFQSLCDKAFRTGYRPRPQLDTMSDDGEVFLNADTQSRVPSFYWPKTESRFNPPQQIDRHKEPSQTILSKRDPTVPGALSPYPSPTNIPSRPESAMGMGAIVHREENDEEAGVIIDRDGLMRVMSAAEATQRQLDLQRAVMEKMCTGVIGASSQVTEVHLDESSSSSRCGTNKSQKTGSSMEGEESEKQQQQQQQQPLGKRPSTGEHTQPQPQRTKSALIRKLSTLGIGRRKTISSGNRDTVGFSRIAEAV